MHFRILPYLFLLPLTVPLVRAGTSSLSLPEALARSLRDNPALQSYNWDIRAAEARIIQAGLRPNPLLSGTAENLPGSGDYKNGDLMEHTLQLSQLVELGGKLQARVNEAEAGRTVAEWAYQVRRVEVLKNTTQAFVAVLSAQRAVQLAEETATLAAKITPTIQKRVDAGKANPVEVMRSNVAVASAKIEMEQAQRTLATARIQLATQWGGRTADFDSAQGNLETLKSIPAFSSLVQKIQNNPEVARWTAERARREAVLAKERTLAKADITVLGGPRMVGKADDLTFTLGFSIPLPFKNKNQGNIAEAEAQIAKTDSERESSETTVFSQLSAAWQVLARAAKEVEILDKDVLPGAQQAEAAITEGYEAGRFTQLEILDARRTLIQARQQRLRALADYHQALAEVEALTARPISLPRVAVPVPTGKPAVPSKPRK